MALLEKVQRNIYPDQEDKFKSHLGVIQQVNVPFATKPKLKPEVKSLIYKNHREDLQWLKDECGIDFLNDDLEEELTSISNTPTIKNEKVTVRDVYQVEDEQSIERYEVLVMDALLKKLVQSD